MFSFGGSSVKKKQYQKEKMSRKTTEKSNRYCTAKPNPEPNETETSNKSKPQTKHSFVPAFTAKDKSAAARSPQPRSQ